MNPKKTPQLITCHGSDITYPIEKPHYRAIIRHTLKKADRIITVSDYIREKAIQLGAHPGKTTTIYLGVDVKRFHLPPNRRSITIGTLGRLVREKNIDELLYAVKKIQSKVDLKVLIGGDGPDQGRLMRIAEKLEVNAKFTGRVKDPVSFHQDLNIFVLASTREGLSLSLKEAMACGAVPIVVRGYGCEELVFDQYNGYTYNSGYFDMLAEKILSAINDDGEMANKARETITTHFNNEDSVKKYLNVYREFFNR